MLTVKDVEDEEDEELAVKGEGLALTIAAYYPSGICLI
jgi:hypothetical protein